MNNCKLVFTPLAVCFKLSTESCLIIEEEMLKMSHVPHSSAVGSLMYAMVCSKPNLSYTVAAATCIILVIIIGRL